MASNYENFQSWYVEVLKSLFHCRDAGFPILMVTFPLLERYIRNKVADEEQTDSGSLSDEHIEVLRQIFPALTTNELGRKFWKVYRHGLLHQVTLNHIKGYAMKGWLSHDVQDPVSILSGDAFFVHPVLFSEQVLHIIESDFSTFEYTKNTTLPTEKLYPDPSITITGTNTGCGE